MPFYKLEKLVHSNELSGSDFMQACRTALSESGMRYMEDTLQSLGVYEDGIGDKDQGVRYEPNPSATSKMVVEAMEHLAYLLYDVIDDGDDDKLSPLLAEACHSIKRLIAKNRTSFGNDLHPGNIMFRRTPIGYQLVITDPVS